MVRFAVTAVSAMVLAGVVSAGLALAQGPAQAPAETPVTEAPAVAASAIRDGDAVVLSRGEWRCISSRLDRFAESKSSRIIIPVLDCPVAQEDAPAAQPDAKGLSLDFQATRGISARRAYRGLLIVSRDELDCLITLRDAEVAAAAAPAAVTRSRSVALPPSTTVTLDLAAAKCQTPATQP